MTLSDEHLIRQATEGKRGEDQRLIAEQAVSIIAQLLRKNADYGSSAFSAPILAPHLNANAAIKVRLSDKIERLKTLARSNGEVRESLEDTKRDIVGYILLDLTFQRRESENAHNRE